MTSSIENIDINYDGNIVNGKKLIVTSVLDIDINTVWNEVQKSSLLEFVCDGRLKFKPVDSDFPKLWKKGMTIKAKLLVYGFIPFGGIHSLDFKEVKPKKFYALTNEKNSIVKVWNHKIQLKKTDDNQTNYTDEIEVYAGILTTIITKWAESLYKYRQRRWKLVVKKLKTKAKQRL